MSTVTPPTASSPAGPSASSEARASLADNFDSFLKLLTTQLTNQDPLQPMDANEFTAQLVQFSGVEQSIKTNQMLDELISLTRADQLARSADYLGAEVEADGATVRLTAAGPANLTYRLEDPAAAVELSIRDAQGKLVWQAPGVAEAGAHAIAWNGRSSTGERLPEGLYTLEVAAIDGAGRPLTAATGIAGTVDGVEITGDQIMLSIEGVLVALGAVTALRRAPADTSS